MALDLIIHANYQNIENIFIDPIVEATIRCSFDNTIHPKSVLITSDSIRRNDKNQPINFKAKCTNCTGDMTVNMTRSSNNKYIENEKEYFLSEKKDNDFIVASFKSSGCVIESVEILKMNVLANDMSIFEDIKVKDGYWCEEMKRKIDFVSVQDLKWELRDGKKGKK